MRSESQADDEIDALRNDLVDCCLDRRRRVLVAQGDDVFARSKFVESGLESIALGSRVGGER